MHLTRALPLLAALILALVSAGCDSGGGGGPAADAMNGVDTAGPDTVNPDVVAEDTTAADVPGEDSPAAEIVDPPPCEGPGVAGQVIQAEGGPISGAKLFLCGTVNGAETCSPRTADDQGFFSFQTLDPGYTHLEVNATLAGFRMEKLFVGYSLAVDPSGPDCLDMGEIVLQELPEGGENVVTADGGAVQIGALTLEFPPGCPVFPDFSGEAAVGGAEVDVAETYWAPDGAVMAVAFQPFKAHCGAGVTIRIGAAADLVAPTLLFNDLEFGGALEVGAMAPDGDGWVSEGAVPDLTWIWVTD